MGINRKNIPLPNYFIGLLSKIDRGVIEKQIIDIIIADASRDLKSTLGIHYLTNYTYLLVDYLIIISCSDNLTIGDSELENTWSNVFTKSEYKFAKQVGVNKLTYIGINRLYEELCSNIEPLVNLSKINQILNDEILFAEKRISSIPLKDKEKTSCKLFSTESQGFFEPLMTTEI